MLKWLLAPAHTHKTLTEINSTANAWTKKPSALHDRRFCGIFFDFISILRDKEMEILFFISSHFGVYVCLLKRRSKGDIEPVSRMCQCWQRRPSSSRVWSDVTIFTHLWCHWLCGLVFSHSCCIFSNFCSYLTEKWIVFCCPVAEYHRQLRIDAIDRPDDVRLDDIHAIRR